MRVFVERVADLRLIDRSLKLWITFHPVFDVSNYIFQNGFELVLSPPPGCL
jgi:hypothetical protein